MLLVGPLKEKNKYILYKFTFKRTQIAAVKMFRINTIYFNNIDKHNFSIDSQNPFLYSIFVSQGFHALSICKAMEWIEKLSARAMMEVELFYISIYDPFKIIFIILFIQIRLQINIHTHVSFL